MAKEPQELKWIEELLPDGDYRRKAMFGGFGYYLGEKIVLVLFESKDKKWNGCMFPLEKEFHPQALSRFPDLKPHPILPKWLYLPLATEGFDDIVTDVVGQVRRKNSFWGSIPKGRGNKSEPKKKKDDLIITEKIDTRRPRMFSDEPIEDVLNNAKKVSDLKNLGEVTEQQLAKVGIKTAQQFIKLGWKKTMQKLVAQNPKYRHSLYAYALIGALKNTEFTQISDDDKAEAKAFVKSLPVDNKKAKKKRKI